MALPTSPPGRRGYHLTSCLYLLIGLLALLQLGGVIVAVILQQDTARDSAALDRVVRGTIHLERINGLVYAVVMESRGIYMSPDWRRAEKFGRNLIPQLEQLQETARAWREEAVASQQANVEELARRIDEFVSFRTELVRRSREESTASARDFGDNDANRNVRTALNESLTALAHAYEQEISTARRKVEANQRFFLTAQFVRTAFALISLCVGLLLLRSALLAPLLRLKEGMLRLARGDLDRLGGPEPRAAEIADMAQAVEVFRSELIERQRLSRETALLSALNQWLQSSNTLDELYEMVGSFLARMLPNCGGSLFIYANSRDVLEKATTWNGGKHVATMRPEDCWGLRRGRAYTFGEQEIDFPCAHVTPGHSEPYCCIPILARGETIGLLHLQLGEAEAMPNGPNAIAAIAEQRRLGVVCAEQISPAIANVMLRDQLRDQSIRDPLTGLFNRRYLIETCRREFARALRAGGHVGLFSIDVDHFKKFNDNFGHDAGDNVLRAVGRCMDALFRAEDVPCRFGGEEFVIILPGTDADTATQRAEQLRQSIEALVVRYLEQDLPRISVSIGVAVFPEAGDTPEAVLKAADDALYRAKANGRNRVESAGRSAAGFPSAEPTAIAAMPTKPLIVVAEN